MSLKKALFRGKHVGRPLRWAHQLEANGRLSPEQLAALSWQRLQAVVTHCALHVPFYRDRFAASGFHPQDLKTEKDFEQLPLLRRDDIREHRDRLIAEPRKSRLLSPGTTGGTTGRPLQIYQDRRVPLGVLTWRMLNWWGVDISDNSGYLYRAIPTGWRKIWADMALFPTQRAYIAASKMTRPEMARFLKRLHAISPTYLVGYVGAIEAFADYCHEVGAQVPSLRAVWTTAAPLPAIKRRYLAQTFGCPVFSQYGSVELFLVASECPVGGGMHVFSDLHHVECVDAQGRNVRRESDGDLVITSLTNRAFPLLRYQVGDRGRLLEHACACGRPFPLMDSVKGRISDRISLPDGTFVPGEYWTTIFDDWPDSVKAFQVHQRADFTVEVRYQPADESAPRAVAAVRSILEQRLRDTVPLVFTPTTVDVNDNGKTRYVTSDITAAKEHLRP
jgi:phenylacetate-CoA ligase